MPRTTRREILKGIIAASGLPFFRHANAGILMLEPPALPSSAAETDWQYRTSQPGVVWYHDFRSDAEVTQFRENGDLSYDPAGTLDGGSGYVDDPTTCRRITTDGITGGGALRITRPAGTLDGWNWYRPMSPLSSPGNGRSTDDPAANGSITLDADGAWDPGPGNAHDRTTDWTEGNFGPASTGTWDGDQFFLQYKLKVSASRDNGVFGGKVGYITRMNQSLTAQEIVPSYDFTVKKWRIYTGGTNTLQNELHPANVRSVPSDSDIPEEHYWDEWVEYLIHVVPGDEFDATGGSSAPARGSAVTQPGNTRINVWQRREGVVGYTHIFQQNFSATDYTNIYQQAWNAIILSGYFNGLNMPQSFTQDFDQLIFSTGYVPAGRAFSDTTLETAADSIATPGQWTLDPIANAPWIGEWDISWQNVTAFYDDNRGEIQVMGKPQSQFWGANHLRYSEQSNTWVTTSSDVTPNASGHIWCVAFDDRNGDYYHIQQQPNQGTIDNTRSILKYTRSTNTWAQITAADFDVWNNSGTPNPGMAFSHNLLGPGRPGIYCHGVRLAYYDVVNDSWTDVGDGDDISEWSRQNVSLYAEGLGMTIYGSGQDDAAGGYVILDGSPDVTNPTNIYMPVRVHNTDANDGYMMLMDPRDPLRQTIMLLEREGGNVYTCSDPLAGAPAWTLESWGHPFYNDNPYNIGASGPEEGAWTCCSIFRYGVVMALASQGQGANDGGGTMLWRPGGTLSEV